MSVITRWAAITFVVFVITLWAGKYITDNLLPKKYAATAKIGMDIGSAHPSQAALSYTKNEFAAEFQGLNTTALFMRVIQSLNLQTKWTARIYKSDKPGLSPEEAIAYMNKTVKLDFAPETSTIAVTSVSDDPDEAADIANTTAAYYKFLSDHSDIRVADSGSNIRILSFATTAGHQVAPNKLFCFLLTVASAALISIIAGCFIEMILLFVRAAEGEHS